MLLQNITLLRFNLFMIMVSMFYYTTPLDHNVFSIVLKNNIKVEKCQEKNVQFEAIKISKKCDLHLYYNNNSNLFYYEDKLKWFYIDIVNTKMFLQKNNIAVSEDEDFLAFLQKVSTQNDHNTIIKKMVSYDQLSLENYAFQVAVHLHAIQKYRDQIDTDANAEITIEQLKQKLFFLESNNIDLQNQVYNNNAEKENIIKKHNDNIVLLNEKTRQIKFQTQQLDQILILKEKLKELDALKEQLKKKETDNTFSLNEKTKQIEFQTQQNVLILAQILILANKINTLKKEKDVLEEKLKECDALKKQLQEKEIEIELLQKTLNKDTKNLQQKANYKKYISKIKGMIINNKFIIVLLLLWLLDSKTVHSCVNYLLSYII